MTNMGEKGSNIMRVTDPDWPASVLRRYKPLLTLRPEKFIKPRFTGISRGPFSVLVRLSPLPMPFVLGQGFPYRVSRKAGERETNSWGKRDRQPPALNLQHDLPARAFAAHPMSKEQLLSQRVLRPHIYEQTVQRMQQVEDKADDSILYGTGIKHEARVSGAGTSGQGPEPRAASVEGEKVQVSRNVSGSASQGSACQEAFARGGQEPFYSATGETQGADPARMDAVFTHSPVYEGGFLRFPLLKHVHSRTKIAGNSHRHQIRVKGSGEIMTTPFREPVALPPEGKGSSLSAPASRPANSHEVLVQETALSGNQEFAGVKELPKETVFKSHKVSKSNMTVSPSKEGALPRFSLLDFVQARMRTGSLQQPWQNDRLISNNPITHSYSGSIPFTSRRVFTEKAKGEFSSRISRAEESQDNFATDSIRFASGVEEHNRSWVQLNLLSQRGESGAMKKLETTLSVPHQAQRLSSALHSGASSLPLVQLQGEGAADSSTMLLSGDPGSRLGFTGEAYFPRISAVQGIPGESVAPDSGLNSGPGGSGSLQRIDLESLADEVCAIIERRLIMERESRGL